MYGGTILPGCANIKGETKDLEIVSVFEAVGKHANGEFSDEELDTVESSAIPGAGSCGGMYTANTMGSAIEALGMSLPNSSSQNAISEDKIRDCFDAGAAVLNLLKLGIRPRDILTIDATTNRINVILHAMPPHIGPRRSQTAATMPTGRNRPPSRCLGATRPPLHPRRTRQVRQANHQRQ